MSTFLDECIKFAQRHKPKTQFERTYAVERVFEGKTVYQFTPSKFVYLPEIPRETRLSTGEMPTEALLARLSDVFAACKPDLGYVPVHIVVYFCGEDVTPQLIWLVRHEKAALGVDRMNRPVYVKLKLEERSSGDDVQSRG